MSAHIAGMGWITPLGAELGGVCEQIAAGVAVPVKVLPNPITGRELLSAPVPQKLVEHLARNPRLRRSSSISHFAVAAGLAALADADLASGPEVACGTALIFAISDGGVIYTRKFYEQIVRDGAHVASPLLFPETVYNAPASHLAAQLGIDGATYTLVGDATVGLAALKMAEQLLDLGVAERCVVVGCEELDWILCESHRVWRLAASPADPGRGAILAEGAAALVLARSGGAELRAIHDGVPFFRRREAGEALRQAIREVGGERASRVVACANRTFVDDVEATVLAQICPAAPRVHAKHSLGEAPGASALMQVIVAAQACIHAGSQPVLVPVLGWNHQAGAALVGSVE